MGSQHRRTLMIVAFTLSAVVLGSLVFDSQLALAVKGSKPMNVTCPLLQKSCRFYR